MGCSIVSSGVTEALHRDQAVMIRIAPSILSADFAQLGASIAEVEPAADLLHVDVMDGHFVPNLTIGPPVVRSIRQVTALPLDCHLMVSDPAVLLDGFIEAGADSVSVHVEAVADPRPLFRRLADAGVGRGLALNPDTPFDAVIPFLEDVDVLLVMTVHPGFAGQAFRTDVVPKLEKAAERLDSAGLGVDIEVDGGIAPATAATVADAGAGILVAGSAVFGAPSPVAAVRNLRRAALRGEAPVGARASARTTGEQ